MRMIYVEWLRVRRVLKWTAVVMGVLLVLSFVLRIIVIDMQHHTGYVHEMTIGDYGIAGGFIAMMVATILGAPFARENDGHLEVALAKPIGRIDLALRTIGIDAVGIVAALVLGAVFAILWHGLFFPFWITFHASDAVVLAISLLASFAWYALLVAATASFKRGYGIIQGIAWPTALIVAVLGVVDAHDNVMLALSRDTFWLLSRIDPFSYIHVSGMPEGHGAPALDADWPFQLTMLAVLAVGYSALAIVQWRRVEA